MQIVSPYQGTTSYTIHFKVYELSVGLGPFPLPLESFVPPIAFSTNPTILLIPPLRRSLPRPLKHHLLSQVYDLSGGLEPSPPPCHWTSFLFDQLKTFDIVLQLDNSEFTAHRGHLAKCCRSGGVTLEVYLF